MKQTNKIIQKDDGNTNMEQGWKDTRDVLPHSASLAGALTLRAHLDEAGQQETM